MANAKLKPAERRRRQQAAREKALSRMTESEGFKPEFHALDEFRKSIYAGPPVKADQVPQQQLDELVAINKGVGVGNEGAKQILKVLQKGVAAVFA